VFGSIAKKVQRPAILHYWHLADLDHATGAQIGERSAWPARADALGPAQAKG